MKVEWLILADAAQITGNKLYLLGGGWDVLTVNHEFPVTQRCAVAASFSVPWAETNMRHSIEIEIQDEDGKELAKVAGQFEVGRPAGIPVGSEQRTQIAADMGLTFEKPGNFVIVARLHNQEDTRITFRVIGGRSLPFPPPTKK